MKLGFWVTTWSRCCTFQELNLVLVNSHKWLLIFSFLSSVSANFIARDFISEGVFWTSTVDQKTLHCILL